MSKKISLKQFLMKSGRFDRVEECIESIRAGKVTVSNKVISNPNYFFNPKELVKFGDEKMRKAPTLYFIMNKPAGYLSQKAENEKTIYDLINKLNIPEDQKKSLFAVGRLDKDTEGLMIITNDGKLSDFIMAPGNGIVKKYYAGLEKPASPTKLNMLRKGIEIEIDGEKHKTRNCKIKPVGEKEVYISLTEGKKRQIKKMFEAVGNKVVCLKRVSIGGLQLSDLKTGEMKTITKEEIMEKLEF